MKISAKIDYACRALLELSLHWPNTTPLQLSSIAEKQSIPENFLTQILISLKQLGYIRSIRGKMGGYLLNRSPKEISLCDVVQRMGNIGYSETDNMSNGNGNNVMAAFWKEIDQAAFDAMTKINFEIISNRKRKTEKVVMFEI